MPSDAMTSTTNAGFPWRLAIFLYGISYGLCLFFLDAFFWDDWAVKTVSEQMERAYWKDIGFPPTVSFILIDVFQRNPIYIHLATLFMFFACAYEFTIGKMEKLVYLVKIKGQLIIEGLFTIFLRNAMGLIKQNDITTPHL